jgi:CubicO group peptidase (beta-lactamase class C family)
MSWNRGARAAFACLLTAVSLGVVAAPAASGASGADFAAIDAHAKATMEAWGAPGLSFAIARHGAVVHVAAFGVARPDGTPMTTQTPVVIGSVGKSLTALAIRQLVDAGQVDLAAPVTRYLPSFRLAGPATATQGVTIRSLLDHTSGLSTAAGQDPRLYVQGPTMAEVVASLDGIKPNRPAGTYEYSNLNYVILGVVIEAVSGGSYGDYLAAHVFRPLGMTSSAASPAATSVPPAMGHRYLFGLATPFDEPFPTGVVAAGFQVASADDMARYMAALSNGGAFGAITVTGPPAGAPSRPRLGTDWQPIAAGTVSSQSGATLSTNANVVTFPDDGLGVVVLLNANPIQLLGLPVGASGLALDIARMAGVGALGSAGAPTVRTVYVVVDGVLLALTLTLLVHMWRARSWASRLAAAPMRRWFIGRSVVADALLPLAVLLGLPMAIGALGSTPPGDVIAGWRFLAWTLPDLAAGVGLLCAGALLVGVLKLATFVRAGQRLAPSRVVANVLTGGSRGTRATLR